MTLDTVFGTTGHVDWLQECARALLIFAYGVVVLRILGRRVFGRWSAIDTVVAIIAGSSLSRALTGSAPLWGTLAATTLMFVVHGVLTMLAARSPRFSHAVEGRPRVLARDGALDGGAVRRCGVSDTAIGEALRAAGLSDVGECRLILLEPNGRISALKRSA
jgi:uncharacterized membrane protein YcaP (DUF421 family)